VIGAGLAPRAAERFDLGLVCVVAEWLSPLAFLFLLLAPPGPTGTALLVVGQLVYGLGAGLKGPLDLSYRNAVTPDRLRARTGPSGRSIGARSPLRHRWPGWQQRCTATARSSPSASQGS
jgi:hypothetical protein